VAVPPHGFPDYNKMIPHGNDTRCCLPARVATCIGKAPARRRRERHDAGCVGSHRHSSLPLTQVTGTSRVLLGKGADPNLAAAALPRCMRHHAPG